MDKVFATLPDDGVYSSGFAMAEMENGYAILVKATVDKAGTEDKPDPVTFKSIAVTTNPKLEYWVGESFNPAGMEITAYYSNGTTKTITGITTDTPKDVTWTPDGALTTVGTQEITITYGGKTATVKVTVKESTVKSIEVSGYTSTYTEDELFSPNGMTVTVNYTYGAPKTIIDIKTNGDQGVTWTPADGLTTEIKSVKVTYTDPDSAKGSAFIEVPVTVKTKPVTLTEIVATWPNKTYYEEDTLSKSEITVKAHYSGSSDKPLNSNEYELTIEGPNEQTTTVDASYTFSQKGEYTLTVTYTENNIIKTAYTTIEVADKGYTYDDGSKTYSVSNAHGLQAWNQAVQNDLSISCTLTHDITLPTVGEGKSNWTPIGDYDNRYTGTFDGGGYTIKNLTITQYGNYVGMIDFLDKSGIVKNVKLENVNITGVDIVGSVVGDNYGTVIACTASGNVSGTSRIGGVVGYNNGTVTACYHASGNVSGTSNVGGVMGYNLSGTLTACYWSGLPDNDNGGATKVDGTTVTWQNAVDAMNTALESAGSDWRYELTGTLPSLKNQ